MPDNQVCTNPSNSHCSMSQPVQNLSKFSFRIKNFLALSVDRWLLLSVWMSPAVLKTRLLCTVLVGHPIKRQRQPLAGCVIPVENIDNSVSCIKGIKHWHKRQAAGERGTRSAAAVVVDARAHCCRPATSVDRLHRQIFSADTNC